MPPTSAGLGETLDNQRIMKLVEEALRHPEGEREQFLKQHCQEDSGDFSQAWHYVQWEQKMQGFLLEPVIKREEEEPKLEADDLLENRFRILREIAQGGMGVVYEAKDEKLGRRIALKCAKAGFGHELPPEVRHATEVSHPNVCKIYEIHTARVRQSLVDFITMEFLEGETLSSRLQEGPLPQKQQFAIARQLAAGVAEAHRNGVIHGDIKSNNVILAQAVDGSLRAVITDFGLARGHGAEARGIWGTPGYMAPELWLGDQPSVASDIYALGVVFYEMAKGEIPDPSQTPTAKSDTLKATPWLQVASHKPPPVNAQWDRILARCLAPEPRKRFQSADQLIEALAPGHARRNAIFVAAVILAACLTGFVTYKNATAPTERVRLAVTPTDNLSSAEIERLEGTKKTSFELVPWQKAGAATHLLRITVAKLGEQTTVHAALSEAGLPTPLKVWDASYGPGEWKYAPRALAGVVSAGLHLQPLPETTEINEQAKSAYLEGIKEIRQDSTLNAGMEDLAKAALADRDSPLILAAIAEGARLKDKVKPDKALLQQSIEAERQADLRYPDTSTGHRVAGIVRQVEGRFDDAEAEFLRAIELEPKNGENYRRLGVLYERANQVDKALVTLRKGVNLEPAYYKAEESLGIFYLQQGKYQEAVNRLSAAVKLMPSASTVRFNLAMAYTDTGQFDKAERNVLIVLQQGATASAHFQLGKIRMYEGKDREAVPQLLSAVQEAPENHVFWMHLGIAERRIGRMADSRKAMQRGLEIVEAKLRANPRDGDPRSFLSYFCAQLGQRVRGESEAEQALKFAPGNENVIWNTVLTYDWLGMREKAVNVLKSAAPETLEDLQRWPDVADLTADSRFRELTAENAVNAKDKEKRK